MKNTRVRKMVTAAMLGVVGFVLMLLEFGIPIMPGFIKVDFSEIPSLLGAFALGPLWGAVVCLVKNALKAIFFTTTMGVGELSNFLLGVALVVPAGLIYKRGKSRKSALIGAIVGSVISGLAGIATNYFIAFPFFISVMKMSQEAILGMYQLVNPKVESLLQALVMFNMPFTAVKNLINTAVCMLVYKKLSPILKGRG